MQIQKKNIFCPHSLYFTSRSLYTEQHTTQPLRTSKQTELDFIIKQTFSLPLFRSKLRWSIISHCQRSLHAGRLPEIHRLEQARTPEFPSPSRRGERLKLPSLCRRTRWIFFALAALRDLKMKKKSAKKNSSQWIQC